MRSAKAALAALLLVAGAAPLRAQLALAASIGTTFEDNLRTGDKQLIRLSFPFTIGAGSPRSTQLEFEPAAAWHLDSGVTDASGIGYTRVRAFHIFRLSSRFAVGPDFEVFFKTESSSVLGYGFTRLMPGLVAGANLGRGYRASLRARYEFSGGEDPGVASLGRLTIRPTLFWPAIGRFSFWTRGDIIFDMQGRGQSYNVEGNGTVAVDHGHRLSLFVQPRAYLGEAARAASLWRIRTGLVWSLGDLVVRHGPRESDLRRTLDRRIFFFEAVTSTGVPMRRHHAAAFASALLVAGWSPQPATPPVQVVEVGAGDYFFQAPDTVQAGRTEFHVRNLAGHHVMVVARLDSGKTMADFMSYRGRVDPPWQVDMGGPITGDSNGVAVATLDLTPGRWLLDRYFYSNGRAHFRMGMVKEFVVTGPAVPTGAAPEADIIVNVKDFDFELSRPITPGRHTVRFVKSSAQGHEIIMDRLNDGVHLAEWVAARSQNVPGPARAFGGVGGLAAGRTMDMTADFAPGNYIWFCYFDDEATHQKHTALGMQKEIRVE